MTSPRAGAPLYTGVISDGGDGVSGRVTSPVWRWCLVGCGLIPRRWSQEMGLVWSDHFIPGYKAQNQCFKVHFANYQIHCMNTSGRIVR